MFEQKKNFIPNKILYYNIVNGIHKNVNAIFTCAEDEYFNVKKIALNPNSIYDLIYYPRKMLDKKQPDINTKNDKGKNNDKKYAKNKKVGDLKKPHDKIPPKISQKPEINKAKDPNDKNISQIAKNDKICKKRVWIKCIYRDTR